MHSPLAWGGFLLFVAACLAIDLFGFNRKAHAISMKEAAWTSLFWIAIAVGFGGFVYWEYGAQSAAEYYTGYMIEKALSVDNLFVFAFLFGTYFNVPRELRQRVLFWGILSAIVMRFIFIFLGASLVDIAHAPLAVVLVTVAALAGIWFTEFPKKGLTRFLAWGAAGAAGVYGLYNVSGGDFSTWGILGHSMNAVLTFFALILIASAWKLYKAGEEDAVDPKNNAIVKWFSGLLPVHDQYEGTHFLVKKPNPAGKLVWDVHAAGHRSVRRRGHRPDVCNGQHSGYLRGLEGSVHPVHLEHHGDSRSAGRSTSSWSRASKTCRT